MHIHSSERFSLEHWSKTHLQPKPERVPFGHNYFLRNVNDYPFYDSSAELFIYFISTIHMTGKDINSNQNNRGESIRGGKSDK